MKFDFPHQLGRAEARARVEALGDYLKNRHGLDVKWNGDRGTVKGKVLLVSIDGEFTVTDEEVQVQGKDPGILWRRRAIDYLKRKFEYYLDPSRSLDDLPRARS